MRKIIQCVESAVYTRDEAMKNATARRQNLLTTRVTKLTAKLIALEVSRLSCHLELRDNMNYSITRVCMESASLRSL